MAFTKIVGAGIHTLSNVHTHNINSSGIITATNFVGIFSGTNGDFSGNVTIDGNLIVNGDTTTLNTTLREVEILRVDANNSTVGAAITQSGTGDILNLYDGSTEVFSVADGGAVTTGDHITLTGQNPRITFTDTNHNPDFEIYGSAGIFQIWDSTNNASRLVVSSDGNIGINQTSPEYKLVINEENTVGTAHTIIGASLNPIIYLDAGNEVDRSIVIKKHTTANGDKIGGLVFVGSPDATNYSWAGIKAIQDTNSAAESLVFYTSTSNTSGANSNEVVRIKGNSVGIGTNNPASIFHLNSSSTAEVKLTLQNTGGTTGIYGNNDDIIIDADKYRIRNNNGSAEYVRITSAGRVGINETSPNATLHIKNADGANNRLELVHANDSANEQNQITFKNNTTQTAYIVSGKDGSNNSIGLAFGTGTTERLRITSGGQVNIAGDYTQSAYPLSVTHGSAFLRLKDSNEGNYDLRFMIQNSEANIWHYGTDDFVFGNRYDRKLHFITNGSKRLTINGDLVGINDTDPSYHLNVAGNNASSNGTGMLKGIIGVQNNTTAFGSSPTAGISFQTKYRSSPDVPLDVASIWGGKENSNDADKDGYLGFATREEGGSGNQERMRITSGGRLGIANASPLYRVDIGDGTNGNDPASGYQFRINAYGDYIFALAKQSTPSFSIRNNSTAVVHLNTQNGKRLALGVSSGNNSGSIEEHVNINSSGSLIVGSASYGAAGSFSVGATGTFRQVLASGTSQDTLIGAISGVSNGFQITTDANNAVSYKFHNGSNNTNIIKTNGYFGTGTSNPVSQFVVSKQGGEGVEFVPGNRTDENDIYHFDRGSNLYCSYRTYATKHEFWQGGSSQGVEVTPQGNLKIYHGARIRLATSNESDDSWVNIQSDNHYNVIFGLNLHLNYSGNSGTHQVKQRNTHGTIGSAGMFIGGNGSSNNSNITFFRNAQGSSANTVFAQDSWKFQIGSALRQNFNLQYLQRGYFKTDTNNQNANNFPLAAGSGIGGYSFGYQEAFSTSNGSWVHPYPDLVLGYHTGTRFGSLQNYGGCRFFGDHPNFNTSVILSVGNGGSGVHVTNTFTAGSNKGFRIAHPHPSKKYTHDLVHNAIEAPQMDLIYRGKIDLVNGSATVNIDTKSNMTDGTFVLLNRDVQCFTSNETGWTAVKGSVSGNILTITAQDNSCTDTISWMVVGERQDDKIKSSELTTADGDLIVEPLTIEETHM